MKKRLSIHDIATHLKVSSTTVSFVLNGKAEEMRISEAVAKRILDYAESVSYRPNLIAKSLRTGKSRIIGMMVEDISDPFFSSIARGIERIAYNLGYKIFFASTENETDKAKALVKVFRERQVDAYIIAPPPLFESEIKALLEEDRPIVLFDRFFPDVPTHNVIIDNHKGTYEAIHYLLQKGYENIAFVTLDSTQSQMSDRMQGYLDAIGEQHKHKYILQVPYLMNEKTVSEKIKAFLLTHPAIDAVLFGTNYLTLDGLDAIGELHRKVPDDIAVISFDDSTVFHLLSPSVTAIAQPVEAISEAVVKKILWCLENEKAAASEKTETVVLPTEFIERGSATQKVRTRQGAGRKTKQEQ